MVFAWLLVYCLKNRHGNSDGMGALGFASFVELMVELFVIASKTGVVCR